MRTKRLLLTWLFACLLPITVLAEDVYTVVGNCIAIFETAWDAGAVANNLVLGKDGKYAKTYKGIELTNDYVVEYKVVKNHSYDCSWPIINANYKVCEGDGKYDVTFMFNLTENKVDCTMKKQVTDESVTKTKTIYLKPGVWNSNGARFAVYIFKDVMQNSRLDSWLDFTASKEEGVYTVAIPADMTGIILYRMNGETTENNWNNTWNHTANINFTEIADNTLFTITDWNNSYEIGTYFTKPANDEIKTVTFANELNWENVYVYTWSESGIEYDGNWPGTKIEAVDGVYKYSTPNNPTYIIFNDGSGNQTADLLFKNGATYYCAEIAEITSVELLGQWNNWTADAPNLKKVEGKDYVYKGEIDLTSIKSDQEFKLAINGGSNVGNKWKKWIGRQNISVTPAEWFNSIDNYLTEDNLLLYNSVTGYQKYKVTAVWSPNPLYYQGWSLIFEGIEERPIEKVELTLNALYYELPEADILFDGEAHGAYVRTNESMGAVHIIYTDEAGNETEDAPSALGTYYVSFTIEEGALYKSARFDNVGTFTIYPLDQSDWQTLMLAYQMVGGGKDWKHSWDFSSGELGASKLYGVTYEKGHIACIDLSNNGLSGNFPFALMALPNLTKLDVCNNQLSGDIGLLMAVYMRQNPKVVVSLKELNVSHNQLTGNIGAFAYFCPNLTSLNASDNCLEDVYPKISPNVTKLNLGKQTITRVVPLHLAKLSLDSIATKVPSILLYDHQNQTFTPNINLLCTTPDNTWGMTMAYQNGVLSIPYDFGQNTYYGGSGDTLNVAVYNNIGTPEGSTFRISLSFDEGDSNFDGKVNILDLQTSILYIMEKYQTRPYNFTAANLWKDEQINVQDLICQVNLLMGVETADAEQIANARRNAPATNVSAPDAEIYVQDHQLMLNTVQPIAAFDIVVSGANSMNTARGLEQAGMSVSTKVQRDGLHIIGYALNGAYIPTGVSLIGALDANASVRSVMLSDSEANAVSVAIGGTTTGIKDFKAGKMKIEDTVYDLQGRKVSVPRKGIYIQNGHKVVK